MSTHRSAQSIAQLLSVSKISGLCDVAEVTVRRWMRMGELPVIALGTRRLVRRRAGRAPEPLPLPGRRRARVLPSADRRRSRRQAIRADAAPGTGESEDRPADAAVPRRATHVNHERGGGGNVAGCADGEGRALRLLHDAALHRPLRGGFPGGAQRLEDRLWGDSKYKKPVQKRRGAVTRGNKRSRKRATMRESGGGGGI